MSNENNRIDSEEKKKAEKPFSKGWNSFVDGMKGGFEKFQKTLEDQYYKNKESLEKNKTKVDTFFKDTKEEWDKKLKEINADMERRTIETKEQWEAHTKKVNQDIKSWQEKTKDDWKDGVTSIRKGFLKGYFWVLLLTLPILIIVVVVLAVVMSVLR